MVVRCIQKHGFALYPLVNQQIVDVFCNNPGRLGKEKLPFGNILPAFEKSEAYYSRTVTGRGQPWDKGQDSIQDRETLCPHLLTGRKHTSDVSESPEHSLFRGFCVFPERGCLCCNGLHSKEFNGICPKSHCELRHFRDSEKRLPCGIRTGDLRRPVRKKSRFFQKSGANLHPCLAITPIERIWLSTFFHLF